MKKWIICLLIVVMMLPAGLCEAEYDIAAAIENLKTCWREEYSSAGKLPGYLEIKNTRVVVITDEPKAPEESVQPYADAYFADVDYIVEFMLYSDLMGMAPYYQAAGVWDCVVVYKDGSVQTPMNSPFDEYRARTYTFDVAGIIADVIDLGQEYNAAYRLLEE